MTKIFFAFTLATFLFGSLSLATSTKAAWKATTPEGYTPITWAKAPGVASFMRAPESGGHLDFLTFIHLPSNQVKLIASSIPRLDWGPAKKPFIDPEVRNLAFTKIVAEKTKKNTPDAKFLWNVPFFNLTIPTTDLSLSLKSTDPTSTYITSGSRPTIDMAEERKMLIVNNKKGAATITDFDEDVFVQEGDQAVEGFAATVTSKGTGFDTARLFLGIKPDGKELVVYCSQGASPNEAIQALLLAGVEIENQLQADGGGSATCGYNLPGHYFVEPGRALPHLMGAFSVVRGTVTTNKLNVRSGPGTKYGAVRQLKNGTALSAFEEKNGWLRISEKQEWVTGQYVKKQ